MLARLQTFSLVGVDAIPVEVEVDVSGGALPATILVGLPDAAVRESTHRVGRAMVNCGFSRPNDRIVINLAPADLPKQAATFDLPISLGILAGSCQFSSDRFRDYASPRRTINRNPCGKRKQTQRSRCSTSERGRSCCRGEYSSHTCHHAS